MKRLRVIILSLAIASSAGAQAVETPEPFDSAGRVTVVTPSMAARLSLSPPAWRITGDYVGARLFALGDRGYVIVVERRDGPVERYAITGEDREYLRARTSTLPPGFDAQLEKVTTGLGNVGGDVVRVARSDAFIFNQGVLALAVYGPSFAYALSNETAGRIAAYVLGAGGTFYAATQVARELRVTPQQNALSTHAAIHGAGIGLGLAYGASGNTNVQGAATFLGGVGGTALALAAGSRLRDVDVAGAVFGADASLLVTYLILRAGHERGRDFPTRTEAAVLAAGTAVGYPLGMQYARYAAYNVTAGDVGVLWTTGAVGALAAGTIAHALTRPQAQPTTILPDANATRDDRDRHRTAVYGSAAAGFLIGAAAGDLLLVRRFDHTTPEAGIVALGAAAGALMGAGAYALANPPARLQANSGFDNDAVAPYAFATAGAIAGVAIAEAFLPPRGDAGRQAGGSLRVNPLALALAASRTPGHHSLVQLTF